MVKPVSSALHIIDDDLVIKRSESKEDTGLIGDNGGCFHGRHFIEIMFVIILVLIHIGIRVVIIKVFDQDDRLIEIGIYSEFIRTSLQKQIIR